MAKTKLYLTLALAGLVWQTAGCTGPKQVQGTYQVTGSSGVTVNINYALSGYGSNSIAVSQTLPWSTTFKGYETEGNYQGSYVYLAATNDTNSSSVTITILEEGSVYQAPNYSTPPQTSVTLQGYF